MKYYYDMHIHSVLSPCGDYLMTPNNILNMALLNELDIIAVTDHNSMLQIETIDELKESFDFLIIYGCELQVEGGHLLVYFKNRNDVSKFQQTLDTLIDKKPYDQEIYGEQTVCNIFDEDLYYVDYHLAGDLKIDLKTLLELLKAYDCLKVLAHLDKAKYSLVDVIDEESCKLIDAIELCDLSNREAIIERHGYLKDKMVLQNSDAHLITDINEKVNCIELDSFDIDCLFKVIRNE